MGAIGVRVPFLIGHTILLLEGNVHQRLEAFETRLNTITTGTGLILERPLLADILQDRGSDVGTSQRGCRSFG